MAEIHPLIKPRHLVSGGIGLIFVQLGLVVFFGFTPPQFKAGYHVDIEPESQAPAQTPAQTPAQPETDDARLRELAAILSPAPVLAWTQPTSDYSIPNIIAPEVVLNFGAGRIEDEATPQPSETDETSQPPPAETDTARISEVPPSPPGSLDIKPVYIETLPDLSELETKQRKKQFIAFMLPLILRANLEIEHRRMKITETFNAGNTDRLKQWAELYRFNASNMSAEEIYAELLTRVRPVPVSIALSQAAVESGWGTSRFAKQGNAVYGQWAWSADAGIKPKDSSFENVVIRSFANLFDSVRAYMHNLNTHRAYAEFRTVRYALADAGHDRQVPALLATLDQYSEKREAYIKLLVDVIDHNALRVYDRARLIEE